MTQAAKGTDHSGEESPVRVLLTEDSEDIRALIETYLRDDRFVIESVESGEECIARFREERWDVVLMDIQLPGMDGYEATRALRAWEEQSGVPRTPVVALTADALAEDRVRSLEAGCDEHVSKPVQKKELVQIVLGRARRAGGAALPAEIRELQPEYVSRRREEVGELRQALRRGDFATVSRIAHNMRGTGVSFGLPEVTEIGARLAGAAEARDAATAERCTDRLADVLSATGGADAGSAPA